MYPLPQRVRNRTYQTVESDVAIKNVPAAVLPHPYLACRYSPFNVTGTGSRLPDGRGRNTVLRDFKSVYHITTTGQCRMRLSPIWPYPVSFLPDSTCTVNTVPFGLSETVSPGVLPPNYVNLAGSVFDIAQSGATDGIVSGRILTVGWQLYYTGKVADSAGLIVVDEVPFTVVQTSNFGTQITQPGLGNDTSAAKSQVPGTTTGTIEVKRSPHSYYPAKTQVVLRPEQGCRGVLKANSNSDAHTFKPWSTQGVQMVMEDDDSHNTKISLICSQNATDYPTQDVFRTVNLVDDHFDETIIRITDAGSFRLELIVCLETEVAQTSALLPFASPSPTEASAVLKLDNVLNSLSRATPLAESVLPLVGEFGKMSIGRQRRRRNRQKRKTNANSAPQNTRAQKLPGTGTSRSARRRRAKRKARSAASRLAQS